MFHERATVEGGLPGSGGDETQAGSDIEDDDPPGGRADRVGDRAVTWVVEISVTGLRRGEGDDEAIVTAVLQPFGARGVPLDYGKHAGDRADEASNSRPDDLLGLDLLPALPGHQDNMADRGHHTEATASLRRHPEAEVGAAEQIRRRCIGLPLCD